MKCATCGIGIELGECFIRKTKGHEFHFCSPACVIINYRSHIPKLLESITELRKYTVI